MSIFRRRLMMGEKKPIEYLEFEDRRVWEICCYNWGDTKLAAPSSAFATGEIEADGSVLVVCDHVFASCMVHPKRKYSNGTSPAKVNAAARTFEVELQFDSANPFSSIAAGTTVIEIRQYASNTSTQVVVGTLAKEDVVLDGDNKLTITTSGTTNACQYLTVAVLADNGVKATYTMKVASTSASGIYQPVGITQAQCAAVSSIGTEFKKNKLVTRFNELQLFSSITGFSIGAFEGTGLTTAICPNQVKSIAQGAFGVNSLINIQLPSQCTTIGKYAFINSGLTKLIIPPLVTEIKERAFYNCSNLTTLIMQPTTPPTLGSNNWYHVSNVTIYVPDDSVSAYKAAANWSSKASVIKPISQLPE